VIAITIRSFSEADGQFAYSFPGKLLFAIGLAALAHAIRLCLSRLRAKQRALHRVAESGSWLPDS
jgi:hypothetical protein